MENEWDDVDFEGGWLPERTRGNQALRYIKDLEMMADGDNSCEVLHLLKRVRNGEVDYFSCAESELKENALFTSIYNTRDRIYPPEAYE